MLIFQEAKPIGFTVQVNGDKEDFLKLELSCILHFNLFLNLFKRFTKLLIIPTTGLLFCRNVKQPCFTSPLASRCPQGENQGWGDGGGRSGD